MALVSIDNINCDTILGIWKKEEAIELLESVYELNTTEKAEYKKISNEGRRKEWLLVRILLTEMIQKRVTIVYNINKKPLIKNSDINITISHSKNFVTIITSKTEFAGIDVEHISERVGKVKHKFLNSDELSWCNTLELQTACWSAKESVFKLYEKNLDFHDMIIEHFDLTGQFGKLKLKVVKKDKEGSYMVNIRKIENDIITYATSKTAITV